MKARVSFLSVLIFTAAACVAQTETSSNPTPGARLFPAGTVIPAQLSKSLDTKKVKPGDKFEAKVTMDLISDKGVLVIARDSTIVGHVTGAKARDKQSPDSMVSIAFDSITLKSGVVPIQAALQAIGKPLPTDTLADQLAASHGMSAPGNPGGDPSTPNRPGSPSAFPDQGKEAAANAPAPGTLPEDSQGVVGMDGVTLKNDAQGSVISSAKDNVRLASGTQMIVKIQ